LNPWTETSNMYALQAWFFFSPRTGERQSCFTHNEKDVILTWKGSHQVKAIIFIRVVNTWPTVSVHEYSSHTIKVKRTTLLFLHNHGGEAGSENVCWSCHAVIIPTDKGVYVLIKTVFTVKLLKKRKGHRKRPENGNPILPQFISTKRMQWCSHIASAR